MWRFEVRSGLGVGFYRGLSFFSKARAIRCGLREPVQTTYTYGTGLGKMTLISFVHERVSVLGRSLCFAIGRLFLFVCFSSWGALWE